jgi:hypothetical protein
MKGKHRAENVVLTGKKHEVCERVKGWKYHLNENNKRERIMKAGCTCDNLDYD